MNWKTCTALQLWRLNFSILVLPSGLLLHFHLEFDDTRRTSPSPGLILNKTLDLISLCLLYPFLTVLQTVLYYAQVNISFFVSPLSRHAVLFFKVGCQENLWLDGMPFSRNELNLWNLWITFYICMISFFFFSCMQCSTFPCCCHVLHHMVVYSICWWVFQSLICKTWNRHIW